MIEIARMMPHEEPAVRRLFAECHPTWTPRPPHWYELNPTSIALDFSTPHVRVVGARSVTVDPTGHLMHLQGLMIDPKARGLGVGDLLFAWEIEQGREMGVVSFLSTTWPSNAPMRKLFLKHGFHYCTEAPGYYHENDPPEDGLIYARHLFSHSLLPQCQEH